MVDLISHGLTVRIRDDDIDYITAENTYDHKLKQNIIILYLNIPIDIRMTKEHAKKIIGELRKAIRK